MPGLKKHYSDIRFSGNKITPDEIDRYERTYILYPSASTSYMGTAAAGTSGEANAFVMTNQALDYPRTLLVTCTNSAGSLNAGTVHIVGTDQFGKAMTEDIAFSGTAATTKAGTGIFKTVTAGTITFGTATQESGTPLLGVAVGTAANLVGRFGLGFKIGAASDVKRITWINNGTATAITAGTVISTLVSATSHSFAGTKIIAATDIYSVEAVPSYNAESEVNVAA